MARLAAHLSAQDVADIAAYLGAPDVASPQLVLVSDGPGPGHGAQGRLEIGFSRNGGVAHAGMTLQNRGAAPVRLRVARHPRKMDRKAQFPAPDAVAAITSARAGKLADQ